MCGYPVPKAKCKSFSSLTMYKPRLTNYKHPTELVCRASQIAVVSPTNLAHDVYLLKHFYKSNEINWQCFRLSFPSMHNRSSMILTPGICNKPDFDQYFKIEKCHMEG